MSHITIRSQSVPDSRYSYQGGSRPGFVLGFSLLAFVLGMLTLI